MGDILINMGVSAIAGALYGTVGYFKNKKTEDMFHGFNTQDFCITVIGSAVFGGMSTYMGITADEVSTSAFGVLITQTLKKLLAGLLAKK